MLFTEVTTSLIEAVRSPLASSDGHSSSGAVPRTMFTARMSSLMMTEPSPSQSPAQDSTSGVGVKVGTVVADAGAVDEKLCVGVGFWEGVNEAVGGTEKRGVGVGCGVPVSVPIEVCVGVCVAVAESDGCGVGVRVSVRVAVGITVGLLVLVAVRVVV